MSLRQAARQALEALEDWKEYLPRLWDEIDEKAVTALRTALAEPVQEPVAWKDTTYGNLHHQNFGGCIPLYTHPVPQPVELTDDDLEDIAIAARKGNLTDLRNAIERAHGIGGEE